MAQWDPSEFQATLQAFLERRGWSRNEFAMRIGISQGVVNRWFQRDQSLVRPRPESLLSIAQVLEMPHNDLLRMCGYLSPDQGGKVVVREHELEILIRDLEAGWLAADAQRRQIGADTVRAIFNVHDQRRPSRRARKGQSQPEEGTNSTRELVRLA